MMLSAQESSSHCSHEMCLGHPVAHEYKRHKELTGNLSAICVFNGSGTSPPAPFSKDLSQVAFPPWTLCSSTYETNTHPCHARTLFPLPQEFVSSRHELHACPHSEKAQTLFSNRVAGSVRSASKLGLESMQLMCQVVCKYSCINGRIDNIT
jgi:hypothetical protein